MSVIIEVIVFLGVSTFFLWFSWSPLHDPLSHGFYRFFAWEAILALILLNARVWFSDPFSWLQIASWILLTICIVLAIHGFYMLKAIGKPSGNFEQTTMLVREGAYKYIRHPLYSSLLFMAWGVFLKNISIAGFALVITATIFLVLTGRIEEKENVMRFGQSYTDYMKKTRMFIPYLF